MTIRRIAHPVYGTKHHLVYIGREDIRARVKEIFSEVEEYHRFEIEEIRVAFDHVHIFF